MSKPQVLVAEDDRVVSLLIARSLEGVGAQITTVYDGLEAFEVGLTTDFNLVLLDQVMPGLLGVEVLQRWIDDGKNMPVIMVSALTAEEDIVRCLELGAVDFIRKPFSVRELLARAKVHLRSQGFEPDS
ncbi:MAG: response regulator transcription factor [Acidimicrobiia bacterium]|nr:response regulator transcription factor [Acidimicrobiia bacterium]MDH3396384.1 response regulator transcription factor [Acidimicrobiia bacterium]